MPESIYGKKCGGHHTVLVLRLNMDGFKFLVEREDWVKVYFYNSASVTSLCYCSRSTVFCVLMRYCFKSGLSRRLTKAPGGHNAMRSRYARCKTKESP